MRLYINWELLDKLICRAESHFKIKLDSPDDLNQVLRDLKIKWWDVKSQARYNELYKLYYLQVLRQRKAEFNEGVYFRYYLDFRGRIYADSPISYTFNKTTRNLYYYGHYSQPELSSLQDCLPNVGEIVNNIIFYQTDIKQRYPGLDYTNPIVQYYIYILFFELGKLKKNTIINQSGGRLKTTDFILLGIEYFNKGLSSGEDFDRQVEYISITHIIDTLNSLGFVKIPIYKDATASAIQLLVVLLGTPDEKILYEANLKQSGF